MSCAAFILGRRPYSTNAGIPPYQTLFKRVVDPIQFRPFGCTAYALIPKDHRIGKFSDRGRECIMLGYGDGDVGDGKKAYRLLDVKTRAIFHSRHVQFDEDGVTDVSIFGEADKAEGEWEQMFRPAYESEDVSDSGSVYLDATESVGDGGKVHPLHLLVMRKHLASLFRYNPHPYRSTLQPEDKKPSQLHLQFRHPKSWSHGAEHANDVSYYRVG
ncbi:hypothetical protein DFH06DRAFT_1312942 [Mycena polygramma]|nr:hypothetical protein DFH06DRAFT_1312942 [Mycena polygramma]